MEAALYGRMRTRPDEDIAIDRQQSWPSGSPMPRAVIWRYHAREWRRDLSPPALPPILPPSPVPPPRPTPAAATAASAPAAAISAGFVLRDTGNIWAPELHQWKPAWSCSRSMPLQPMPPTLARASPLPSSTQASTPRSASSPGRSSRQRSTCSRPGALRRTSIRMSLRSDGHQRDRGKQEQCRHAWRRLRSQGARDQGRHSRILPAAGADEGCNFTDPSLVAAINYAVSTRPRSSRTLGGDADADQTLENAIRNAAAQGVLFVISAGNEGKAPAGGSAAEGTAHRTPPIAGQSHRSGASLRLAPLIASGPCQPSPTEAGQTASYYLLALGVSVVTAGVDDNVRLPNQPTCSGGSTTNCNDADTDERLLGGKRTSFAAPACCWRACADARPLPNITPENALAACLKARMIIVTELS